MIAMLLKSANEISKVDLLTQEIVFRQGSLTRTAPGDTPVMTTECSASEYRTGRPSQAVQVLNHVRPQPVSTHTWTGWPAATAS